MRNSVIFSLLLVFCVSLNAYGNLSDTIEKVKPAVVGVGIYTPTGRPQNTLYGTGFVIGDGRYVVTNDHVIAKELDQALLQKMVVFIGTGKTSTQRAAKMVARSKMYDLAILKIEGEPLPTIKLAQDAFVREGSNVAFTGFPIGAILGLYPVTHRAMISSITPTIIPVSDSRQISIKMLKMMKNPYLVYQLDATAYPGNSGSALYDVESGEVVAVINKVFVQETKEAVISKPSGITYAIPVKYLRELLRENGIDL